MPLMLAITTLAEQLLQGRARPRRRRLGLAEDGIIISTSTYSLCVIILMLLYVFVLYTCEYCILILYSTIIYTNNYIIRYYTLYQV